MLKQSNSPRLSTLASTYLSFYFRGLSSPQRWDEQYKAGEWAGLRADPAQMSHHMVVLGYTLRAGANPRILDVGCGSGGWLDYPMPLSQMANPPPEAAPQLAPAAWMIEELYSL
jgi:hypothetical protein